jgi:RES domain-containing protein
MTAGTRNSGRDMTALLKDHPRYRDLLALLKPVAKELAREWSGRVFRCVELPWGRPEYLISGEGTMRHGGRWMRPNMTPVVYAAGSEAIALKESRRPFDYFGIRRPRQNPRVLVEIDIHFTNLADLRSLDRLTDWPALEELLNENWEKVNSTGAETLSQAVGRALFSLRFEGLLVPSSRDRRGLNVIWFPENLGRQAKLTISGESDLNRWLAL